MRRIGSVRAMAAVTVALALAATACGASPGTGSGRDPQAEAEEAGLKFARCMREHGVDMPDPVVGKEGRFEIRAPGDDAGRATVEKAQEACQKYLKDVQRQISPEDRARFEDQALRFARCMRAHGIDVPDPDFSRGGGILIGGPGSKVDPGRSRLPARPGGVSAVPAERAPGRERGR